MLDKLGLNSPMQLTRWLADLARAELIMARRDAIRCFQKYIGFSVLPQIT